MWESVRGLCLSLFCYANFVYILVLQSIAYMKRTKLVYHAFFINWLCGIVFEQGMRLSKAK